MPTRATDMQLALLARLIVAQAIPEEDGLLYAALTSDQLGLVLHQPDQRALDQTFGRLVAARDQARETPDRS